MTVVVVSLEVGVYGCKGDNWTLFKNVHFKSVVYIENTLSTIYNDLVKSLSYTVITNMYKGL